MDAPDATVSIVSLNTKAVLDECLSRIEATCSDLALQVVVVDNGSSDGSAEMVRQSHPSVELILNDSNRFFSAAHNQAFARAIGRYVLILNSDVLVGPGCVRGLVRYMDNHPGIGAAGCLLLNDDGTPARSAWRDPTVASVLMGHWLATKLVRSSRTRDSYAMADWDGITTREVEVAMDALLCVRRDALEAVGGYDERLLLYYTEQDLCLRLRHAGWPVHFFGGSSAVHHHEATSRRMNAWWIWWVRRRDTVAYFNKHQGWVPAQVLNAVWAVDMVLRIPTQVVLRRFRSWSHRLPRPSAPGARL